MQRIDLLRTRTPFWTFIPIALVFACVGYWLTGASSLFKQLVGWATLGFSAIALYEMIRLFLARGPGIVMDASGLHDRTSGYGTIPWTEIRNMHVWKSEKGSGQMLCIEVDHPSTYLARLSLARRLLAKANTCFGLPEVAINCATLDVGADGAFDYAREFLQAHGSQTFGRCPSCGYDVRATPERCPECGTRLS